MEKISLSYAGRQISVAGWFVRAPNAQKEEELAAYQAQLKEPSIQSDYEKLMELEALCAAADEQLEALMMEWEESGSY